MPMGIGIGLSITRGEGGGVNRSALYVIGDSTAKGDGFETTANKWATILAGDVSLTLVNAGVSGQGIDACLTGVQGDRAQANWQTVLMDHANSGETAAGWLATVASIIALQPNILIWPQVGVTDGSMSAGDLTRASDINAGIIANWPNNTFDVTEQTALIAALNDSTTRADGVHRNDKGQAIECFYASAFLSRKGWRTEATETGALVARMTGAPTSKRRSYINAHIERQKGCGAWAKRDVYRVRAAHDEQAANLNWLGSSYTATKVGTVAFVADRGHTGDGSTGYHLTGFNPATAVSPKFVQNDARLSLYVLTNVAENVTDVGSDSGSSGSSRIASRNADGSRSLRINSASTRFSGGDGTSVGYHALNRLFSATSIYQRNAALASETSDTSASPLSSEFREGAGAGSFSTKQVAITAIGAALSEAQAKADYYSQVAWLKALGAA